MGLNETVFGTPPQTQIVQTPAMKPPGYSFARDFFNSLLGISQQPFPTFQGALDPGLSPTMQETIRRAQGYQQSGPPEILAGVQGSLGRFMNPSFINPQFRIGMGAPDYMNQNPNQRIFGGGTVGQGGQAFGMTGPSMTPKPFGGSPTSNSGTIGGPPLPPAFGGQSMAKGGMMPGGMPGGSYGTATGNLGNDMIGAWPPSGMLTMQGPPAWANTLPEQVMFPWPGQEKPLPAPGLTPQTGGGLRPPPDFNGGPTYGGYTVQQLTSDPSLLARLGQAASQRWAARPPSPAAQQLSGIPQWFQQVYANRGVTNPMDLMTAWQRRQQRVGGQSAPPPAFNPNGVSTEDYTG